MLVQEPKHTQGIAKGTSLPRLVAVNGNPVPEPPASVAWRVAAFIAKVVRGSAHNFTIRVGDWALAMMMLTFGFVLLSMPSLFYQVHAFQVLAKMAPALSWGTICVALGGTRLLTLIVNGTFPIFRWSPHIRFFMALLSCFVWFQIILGLLDAPAITPAVAVYPYLFLFDMYNTFLAASEAGIVERRYRDAG